MDDDVLLVDRADGVATITVNRPQVKNAIPAAMWPRLRELLGDLGPDPDVRVVVLTGAGDDFGSGADVREMDAATGRHPVVNMRVMGEAVLALHQLATPTIARVRGVCAGVSLNLALACDLVIADETARFSEIFARRGLSVDGAGSWVLPRLVGMQKAKELVFLAEIIDAHRALDLGLVTRVVAADRLDAEVADVAARLAAGPPIALGLSKKLLDQAWAVSLPQALEAEAQAQAVNFFSRDFKEAVAAFVDKRRPRFEGR